jgi:hypothetical protein
MTRTRVALLLAGLSSVTACKREVKLVHQALPGFSIDLPEGAPIATSTALEYATGSYALRDDAHHRLAILGWSVGTKLTPTELGQMLSIFSSLTHTTGAATVIREPGPRGTTVETSVFLTDRVPIYVTQLECGGRNVVLAIGTPVSADPARAAMLTSFRCTPDPAKEARLGTVDLKIRVDLPGWKMVSHDGGQLMLTDDRSLVMLQPMPIGSADLISAIGPMAKAVFKETVVADPVEGDHVPLHGTIDGQPVVGFGKLIPCKTDRTLVFEVSPDRETADTVRHAFDAATCLAPGEPPPAWPATAN